MATIVMPEGSVVQIPRWVIDHASFLKWVRSGEVPEDVRLGFIRGDVWIENMPERATAHNRIKTAVSRVVDGLVVRNKLGIFFGDGMMYTSESEGFSCCPDGMFASRATIDAKRVWLTGSKRSGEETELVGTPDLMIEVVSHSSELKDTEWYMTWYWNAGIPEYWVIDGRVGPPDWTVYRRGPRGYRPVRPSDGWTKSKSLGHAYRFVPAEKILGKQTYDFEYR
jgi:Uma2 family endonuclease